MKAIVAVGVRFTRWVVVAPAGYKGNVRLWKVRCDCGNEKVLGSNVLTNRNSRSCGCYRTEQRTKHGAGGRTTRTRLYRVWSNMIQRCTNPNVPEYRNYGARGINVCAAWRSFENFARDLGEPPTADMTLDRVDNNGNYEPKNCRWISRGENLRNKRNNVYVEFDGKRQCLMDWSRDTGLHHRTLYQRYAAGDRGAALFRAPKKGERATTWKGT